MCVCIYILQSAIPAIPVQGFHLEYYEVLNSKSRIPDGIKEIREHKLMILYVLTCLK